MRCDSEWSPPPLGALKFNVDRTYEGLAAGCGGVLRSVSGDVKAIFSGPVAGAGSVNAENFSKKHLGWERAFSWSPILRCSSIGYQIRS
ncbi:hypothetical protein F3Y22_tig00110015pilonHSYRG00154 [Hibiscus syriacus]|uniref:RNase H type-1 domain-containing protein n=1 Tax=Hibiscus syriacus TaxID=106335 RepID=A0A6A3BMU4_HIBSY|nr:hypothetical protein F3Y22_tig00110015pilonHSYRG00154 [Hibiscus syriacus]